MHSHFLVALLERDALSSLNALLERNALSLLILLECNALLFSFPVHAHGITLLAHIRRGRLGFAQRSLLPFCTTSFAGSGLRWSSEQLLGEARCCHELWQLQTLSGVVIQ